MRHYKGPGPLPQLRTMLRGAPHRLAESLIRMNPFALSCFLLPPSTGTDPNKYPAYLCLTVSFQRIQQAAKIKEGLIPSFIQ